MSDDKNPIEHAVELTVLAPIGFALEAKRLLPTFVERGRQQVNMARVVGQFAVSHGQTTAAKRLTRVQAQAESILAEFGSPAHAVTTPPSRPPPPPRRPPSPSPPSPRRRHDRAQPQPTCPSPTTTASPPRR